MVDVTKTSHCDVCAQWQPFFISCYTTRSKHQLVAMSEWVNNLRQPLSRENSSSSLPRTQLATVVFYCFKQQLLNKQVTNQHVFIWDSSWKRLDE